MAKQSILQTVAQKKPKSFRELLDSGAFSNKINYPSEDDFTNYYLYEGKIDPTETISASMWTRYTRAELRKHLADNFKEATDAASSRGYTIQSLKQIVKSLGFTLVIKQDENNYNRALSAYHEEESRIIAMFQDCLKDEFGVRDNPKFARCYGLAWEKGHSSGLSEVYNEFCELVELIQPVAA